MAITTDPTPLADFLAAVDAAGELTVHLAPACIASFGGGSFTFTPANLSEFTFREDDGFVIATGGENGKEYVVET